MPAPDANAILAQLHEGVGGLALSFQGLMDRMERAGAGKDETPITDKNIFDTLSQGLVRLSTQAVLMRQQGHGHEQWLGCAQQRYIEALPDVKAKAMAAFDQTKLNNGAYQSDLPDGSRLVFVPVGGDVIVLVNPGTRILPKDVQDLSPTVLWQSMATLLHMIFRQRLMLYGACPEALMWKNWQKAETGVACPNIDRTGGFKKREIKTITLSLDLRKSTFCMEQSLDFAIFATWMGQTAERLTSMVKQYGALFDKFTGDGILAHFPVEESWDYGPTLDAPSDAAKVMERALACAARMIIEVEKRLPDLKRNLRNSGQLLGAGIGMSINKAYWGLDSEGYPLIVGPGVVDACRFGDKAAAGHIVLNNAGRTCFQDGRIASRVKTTSGLFVSKEFPANLKIQCWDLLARDVAEAAARLSIGP